MIHWLRNLLTRGSLEGTKRSKRPRLSNDIKNMIIADRNVREMTYPEIAKRHNISKNQVAYCVKQYKKRVSNAS